MNVTRRNLLRGASLAPFAALELNAFEQDDDGGKPSPFPMPPDDLKLGIASYSFREFQRKTMLSMAKKLRVSYINLKDMHMPMVMKDSDRAKAVKSIQDAGFTILGGGTVDFKKDDDADFEAKFEYAKKSGMPLMVSAPSRTTLPKLEKFVKKYDIKIAVHNHGPEDKEFPTPQSVLEIVKNLDPRMGCCIDIGHTARTGTDPVAAVRDAGSRLLDMHVKDLAILQSPDTKIARESQVPVGQGKMPIAAIFRELKKMNYKGGVMLEYEIHDSDPLPGMFESFSFMRGVLAGLRT
ncbi:MAG: sugar phosphate isomerase/epimerase [Bryobacteraceae bacterium]